MSWFSLNSWLDFSLVQAFPPFAILSSSEEERKEKAVKTYIQTAAPLYQNRFGGDYVGGV